MTPSDAQLKRAQEIADDIWCDHRTISECSACVEFIAIALARERSAALEEAAACAQRVADGQQTSRLVEMAATIIADAVLALRTQPQQKGAIT